MAYWHEVEEFEGSWVWPPKEGKTVYVRFRGGDARKAPYTGYFMRYEGSDGAEALRGTKWHSVTEGWVELWPKTPMLAKSTQEAAELFKPIMEQVENGSIDDQFDIKPNVPPVAPERVLEIEHPTHLATAIGVKQSGKPIKLFYKVYAPMDKYLPVSTPSIVTDPEYEWGIAEPRDEEGNTLRTHADSIESAREIAAIELDGFVARDPEIKRR